jgi:phenylacetate-coenzyme A ligase PaaK-like adenylate-forming protein
MAKSADYGFMIWNGKSRGTLYNMVNLVKFNKKVLVYLIPEKHFYTIRTLDDIGKLGSKEKNDIKSQLDEDINKNEQLSLFR